MCVSLRLLSIYHKQWITFVLCFRTNNGNFINDYFLLQVVAFILIGVAVYGRASALVTNLPIIGGILACGVILFLISILGLIGAVKHHQVLLFFVSLPKL